MNRMEIDPKNYTKEERIAIVAFNNVFVDNALNQLHSKSPVVLSELDKQTLKAEIERIRILLYRAGINDSIQSEAFKTSINEEISEYLSGIQVDKDVHKNILVSYCNQLSGAINSTIQEYEKQNGLNR